MKNNFYAVSIFLCRIRNAHVGIALFDVEIAKRTLVKKNCRIKKNITGFCSNVVPKFVVADFFIAFKFN